ncbi:sugar nucleotide-binding protein, partial [Patescibacteria group bacterium]|nr:sugar nucleotide-binding protein [Patescibacteria group bacterium]
FADQKFTPTYLTDLLSPLLILATQRKPGVYHVATTEVTTPLEFGTYIATLLNMQSPKRGSVQKYLKKPGVVPRAKLGGLTTRITESSLNIRLHSLHEALDECIRYYKPFVNA